MGKAYPMLMATIRAECMIQKGQGDLLNGVAASTGGRMNPIRSIPT